MGTLAQRAIDRRALGRAWDDVVANDQADGSLAPGVSRFAEQASKRLDDLATALADGSYRPRDLTEIELADRSRVLHVPAVVDRVVERSALEVITPYVDPALGPSSYGYRPGLGVVDAVQAVAKLRDEGFGWVLHSDVHDCFPSIRPAAALRLLAALVPDPELTALVTLLMERATVRPGRGRGVVRGLAQGCALSPLLANLVLTGLDDALLAEGFVVVRYADDFVVAATSAEEAWEAVRCATRTLEGMGMELSADKTEVMSFEEGFCFLGEDFGPRYPPVLDDHRVVVPQRRVLYTALQGGRVRMAAGRVLAETAEDVEVLDVPTDHVGRIVCFGSVGLSAGTRTWAMANEVDVTFVSRRGSYLGQLHSASSTTRVERLRAQLAFVDDPVRQMPLVRALVEAKVRKQVVVLQRFGRREHAATMGEAVAQLRHLLALLPECATVAEAMGMEGMAAAVYFPCFGGLFPDPLRFSVRSRQPPLDVTNSALSYTYTLLTGECVSALVAAGLDPAIGAFHAEDEGRPSLALDLVEEFRPLVADQVVVSAARSGELRADQGWSEEGRAGVLLSKAARTNLLAAYERRMQQSTKGALPGFSGTLRRHLYRQAQRLAGTILHDEPWTGLSWR